MISTVTQKLLAMSMLRGIGPATLRKLAERSDFVAREVDELAMAVPALQRAISKPNAWSAAQELAAKQTDSAERCGARILSPLDKDYPVLLSSSKDDSYILFVRGTLSEAPEKSVAIIGTREPTRTGLVVTSRITRYFIEQGWSIVSGLALGCDAIAHQSALESNGHTVAVLAHGLQTIAPARHQGLADRIVDAGGALITQYPMGRPAIAQQFAQRDKTQAGLSQGVVMVQSDLKGGSLIASRAALSYGRWLAVPYPLQEDLDSDQAKVRANRVLAEGAPQAQLDLLSLKEHKALANLIVLRSKDDYPQCLRPTTDDKSNQTTPRQGMLI